MYRKLRLWSRNLCVFIDSVMALRMKSIVTFQMQVDNIYSWYNMNTVTVLILYFNWNTYLTCILCGNFWQVLEKKKFYCSNLKWHFPAIPTFLTPVDYFCVSLKRVIVYTTCTQTIQTTTSCPLSVPKNKFRKCKKSSHDYWAQNHFYFYRFSKIKQHPNPFCQFSCGLTILYHRCANTVGFQSDCAARVLWWFKSG